MTAADFDRVIHIYVKDSKNRLIPGSTIGYELDGAPAGGVPDSEGYATFQIGDRTSVVRVIATVRGKTRSATLAQDADEYTFSFAPGRRWPLLAGITVLTIVGVLLLWNRTHSPLDKQPFTVHYNFATDHPRQNGTCVIFVHGIFGSGADSWLNGNNTFPSLLASDPEFVQSVDVFVFEYYSPYFGNAASIVDLADQLRGALEDHKITERYGRLVFLGHSMGGLVVRELLLNDRALIGKVPMLYFAASPTNGSELAPIGKLFSTNPQLRGMIPVEGNDLLQSIQSGWTGWKEAMDVPSYCSFEELPTDGVIVVSRSSATALCNKARDPITANHVDIVKPPNRDDARYTRFATVLRRSLAATSTPQQHDPQAAVVNKGASPSMSSPRTADPGQKEPKLDEQKEIFVAALRAMGNSDQPGERRRQAVLSYLSDMATLADTLVQNWTMIVSFAKDGHEPPQEYLDGKNNSLLRLKALEDELPRTVLRNEQVWWSGAVIDATDQLLHNRAILSAGYHGVMAQLAQDHGSQVPGAVVSSGMPKLDELLDKLKGDAARLHALVESLGTRPDLM